MRLLGFAKAKEVTGESTLTNESGVSQGKQA
jgi:hypothetical protein